MLPIGGSAGTSDWVGKGSVVTVGHPGMGDKGTILVVEDEESIADLIRLYLERD